jgi:hypothetical protein
MVLELSDFPDGWRASPSTSDKDSADKFRRCIGSDFSALTIIGEAESKDFAHEDTTEASSDSTVFENENQAQDAMGQVSKGMNSPAAEHCFRDLVEKSLSEQESSQGAKIPQYRPSS